MVKTMGDAVMLCVEDAPSAVVLGLRLCTRVCSRDGWPQLSLGIAHGPAVNRGADYFGSTVNRAARICAFARAGEVLADHEVFQRSATLVGVGWIEVGEVALRNIASPVRLHRALPVARQPAVGMLDPVCRMTVDPRQSVLLEHDGNSIGFCSGECAGKYVVEPQRYGG
ncbi:YHS domain-containing protein [Paraconexibacter algicola]|uniref:Guanylate cyclase domain-containing protein n=1 Tax=Paraconexibacter algicola TaxID=2133960 RepID=A0A2T4UM62_9ACTN|nr:YHS domain-containing protein [Paraconexibacter algicola]PTL60291.1 hypothetical protein C7Y72_11900 [Paraconexibacter algicola]